jgi:phosphate transport system protein
MPTHLELTLQRDIDEIRAGLVAMAGLAEQALRDCLRALLENQRQLAYAVILRDQFIDGKEKELDGLCQRFLARQQPVASILRFVYSSIKVNLELERVGDYAESIARQFLKLSQSPVAFPRERFIQIAHLSIPMLHDAIQAFVEQDEALARKTVEIEEAVDIIKSELNRDLVELFRKQEIPFEVLSPLMMIARRFERVSDQARNICMETLYLCTGEHPKHPGSDQVRVLFVDEHHEGLAPMAEAIAKGLGLPQFLFNSAGVDPKPMVEEVVRLMQEKGIDLSRRAPRAIHQIPDLDHYQVVVALSPEVRRAFPKQPRKLVYLDWGIENPAHAGLGPEPQREAWMTAYGQIDAHIRDLVQAVLGTEAGVKAGAS